MLRTRAGRAVLRYRQRSARLPDIRGRPISSVHATLEGSFMRRAKCRSSESRRSATGSSGSREALPKRRFNRRLRLASALNPSCEQSGDERSNENRNHCFYYRTQHNNNHMVSPPLLVQRQRGRRIQLLQTSLGQPCNELLWVFVKFTLKACARFVTVWLRPNLALVR